MVMSGGHDGNHRAEHLLISQPGSQRAKGPGSQCFPQWHSSMTSQVSPKEFTSSPSAALAPRPLEGAILVLVWFGFLRQELMEGRLPSDPYVAEDGLDFRCLMRAEIAGMCYHV